MVVRLAGALTLRERNFSLFLGALFLNSVFLSVRRGVWCLSVPSLKPQCSGDEFPWLGVSSLLSQDVENCPPA